MRDIGYKPEIHRSATAEGVLHLTPDGRQALDQPQAKGDPVALARLVALLWAKKLPQLLPDAHPLRLTHAEIDVQPTPEGARVRATCAGVDRTGVELEALTACLGALVALWDVLKPHEKDEDGQYPGTAIRDVRITRKRKAGAGHAPGPRRPEAAVIVATDSRTDAGDETGPALKLALERTGHLVLSLERIPDDEGLLVDAVVSAAVAGARLVLVAGGTGPGPRDVTPQALSSLDGVELPGFGESLRSWSRAHAGPHAVLTRTSCHLVEREGHRFVAVSFPGHPDAVNALDPLIDALDHATSLWVNHDDKETDPP